MRIITVLAVLAILDAFFGLIVIATPLRDLISPDVYILTLLATDVVLAYPLVQYFKSSEIPKPKD
jgi:small basic protein